MSATVKLMIVFSLEKKEKAKNESEYSFPERHLGSC